MKKLLFLLLTMLLLNFYFCSMEKPTAIDGTMSARFVVIDSSGILATEPSINKPVVPYARVRIISISYAVPVYYETDENGIFEIKNGLADRYRIAVDKFITAQEMLARGKRANDVMVNGSIELDLKFQKSETIDTIRVSASFLSSIVINEIYYASVPNYFSDQFIELYNASDSTQYLDKLLICRMTGTPTFPSVYHEAVFCYQFPGEGRQHPIEPGQVIVIAQDALDHRPYGGIDLSHADWEFYNQYISEPNNPHVPDLNNAGAKTGTADFMLHLKSDEVALIRVQNLDDVPMNGLNNKLFNLESIIDGVEYSPNSDHIKSFTPRIDAGLAGYAIDWHSGRSIERHHPETGGPGYDTNNSTFDFVSLFHPTPGRQHTQEEIIPPLN